MNITKKQLTKLNKFKKAKLPILETALFDVSTLTAVNLGGGSKFEVPVYYQLSHQIEVTGSGCIHIEQFVKIAKKYDIERIDISDNFKAEIITGSGSFTIQGFDPEEFPTVPRITSDPDIQISSDTIDGLKPYTSSDDLRPAMCGIFFDGESLEAVSTDGHRMKRTDISTGSVADGFESFILPNAAISLTDKNNYGHFIADAEFGKYEAIATPGRSEIIFYQTVEEQYPNYKGVWPRDLDNSFEVDKKELQKAVEAALIVSNNNSKQIELQPNAAGMYVYSSDIDLETEYKSESIGKMDNKEEPYKIGFNGGYLSDILKKENSDKIRFQFSGANRAALINDDLILMPVMLGGYI